MKIATKEKLLIRFTNSKLKSWYEYAKADYNVDGSGESKIEGNKFIVNYVENGIKKTWNTFYHPEYLDHGIDLFYNIWAEEAK